MTHNQSKRLSHPQSSMNVLSNVLAFNKNKLQTKNEEPMVFFRGVTWLRDSHGLFDYESRNISKKNMKTQSQGQFFRVNDEVEFMSLNKREEDIPGFTPESVKSLITLRYDKNLGYYVEHTKTVQNNDQYKDFEDITEEESIDRLWLVVRSLKDQASKIDYKIKKFDILKLGRVRFKVKDFRCAKNKQTADEIYREEFKEAVLVKTGADFQGGEDTHCRFCWCNEETVENPLILACQCKGSVGLIHFFCLKSWIQTQKSVKELGENVTSYFWKKFECEICKQYYPYIFKSKDQLFKLIDITYPQNNENYILMESLPIDKNSSRTIHLLTVTPNKQEFKLGRGHESEVRINDISVSRCHAILKYKEDGFYIEDNNSKFGTIALVRDKLPLELENTYAIQIGRTVISFSVRNVDVVQLKKDRSSALKPTQHASSTEVGSGRVKRATASCMRINAFAQNDHNHAPGIASETSSLYSLQNAYGLQSHIQANGNGNRRSSMPRQIGQQEEIAENDLEVELSYDDDEDVEGVFQIGGIQ